MDNFDLDLEDLDLKSVDITHSKSATPNNSFKNINIDNNRSSTASIQASNPNLTVSTNNYDAMPNMGTGNSTDK